MFSPAILRLRSGQAYGGVLGRKKSKTKYEFEKTNPILKTVNLL
jgi:hypothetical protein